MYSRTIAEVLKYKASQAWFRLYPLRRRAQMWWSRLPRLWSASCAGCDDESPPWFRSSASLHRWATDHGWRVGPNHADDVCPRCLRASDAANAGGICGSSAEGKDQ